MKNRTKSLTLIVIVAAVAAALTTLAVICLRMRAKKISRKSYGDTIDYDLDDCCCGNFDQEDELDDSELPVQIPLADTKQDLPADEQEELYPEEELNTEEE